MPIPDEGYPRLAAVSPRVQVVATTDSTNADVMGLASGDPVGWPHLSLLLTDDQRAGRGRLDRSWTTPAGTALAISVVVRVPEVPPSARGWIPLAAGAAMTRAIAGQLRGSGRTAALKWPNDVLVDDRKISGILCEAVADDPDMIVVGVGVNTRMTSADLPVDTAVSFAAVDLEADDDRMLADFVAGLGERVAALAAARGDAVAAGLAGEVEAVCATLGRDVRVALPGGAVLEGRADRLDGDGRLVVVAPDSAASAVSAGDVVHVR